MALLNSPHSYGFLAKALHWLIVVLLMMSLVGGLTGMVFDNQAPHEIIGKIILGLAVVSLIARLWAPRPAPHPGHQVWEVRLSRLVHWALYAILFLYPISGWMMVSAGDWGETGNIGFVPNAWEGALYQWHVAMKWALGTVLLLHLAGAAKHTLIDRDGTLRRMWFGTP